MTSPVGAERLRQHGALDPVEPQTDQSGQAMATWTAFDEQAPAEARKRTMRRAAHGVISVRTTGVVPDWETIELIVRIPGDLPIDRGARRLDVFFFPVRRYRMTAELSTHEIVRDLETVIHIRASASYEGIISTVPAGARDDTGFVLGTLVGVTVGASDGDCLNTDRWGPTPPYSVDVSGQWSRIPLEGDTATVELSVGQPPAVTVHQCGGDDFVAARSGPAGIISQIPLPDPERRTTQHQQHDGDNHTVVTLELLEDPSESGHLGVSAPGLRPPYPTDRSRLRRNT
jgi:hypothetical protein